MEKHIVQYLEINKYDRKACYKDTAIPWNNYHTVKYIFYLHWITFKSAVHKSASNFTSYNNLFPFTHSQPFQESCVQTYPMLSLLGWLLPCYQHRCQLSILPVQSPCQPLPSSHPHPLQHGFYSPISEGKNRKYKPELSCINALKLWIKYAHYSYTSEEEYCIIS